MEFDKYEYADISTAYLEEKDLHLIGCGAPNHLASVDNRVGDFFYVPTVGTTDDFQRLAGSHGLSERFVAIMLELYRQGVPYVRFDRDGGEVVGLDPLIGSEAVSHA